MTASRTATKTSILAELENAGKGHNIQKSLHISYNATDFNQTFIKNEDCKAGKKDNVSSDPENAGQGHCLQKSISLLFTESFLRNVQTFS